MTAVNSAILVLAALLHGVDQVVFSNERSASYGSDDRAETAHGEVNHQWSKGWAFERGFGEHLQTHVAADLQYYSLLRPLSELAVARQFAKTDRYDAHFSSCNRNFHILGERPVNRWCGVCPKCHFVFLALAPFMPKPRLVAIFGRNLLDDPAQAAGFDALAGIPGPQAVRMRGRRPRIARGDGGAGRAPGVARRCAGRSASPARSCRSWTPDELRIEPLLVLDGEHRIPATLLGATACAFRSLRRSQRRRRVALWGWGREGRAACRAIRAAVADVAADAVLQRSRSRRCARDRRSLVVLRREVTAEARWRAFEVVIKSPGISPYRPEARRRRRRRARGSSAAPRCGSPNTPTPMASRATRCASPAPRARAPPPRCSRTCCARAGQRTALVGNIGLPLLEAARRRRPDAGRWNCPATRPAMSRVSGARPQVADRHSTCFPNTWTGTAAKRAMSTTSCALVTEAKPRIAVLNAADPRWRRCRCPTATCAG